MLPPSIEQYTGISVYITSTPGIGGSIRQIPEDFIVEEITSRQEQDRGRYLICTLTKMNWDTHHLVRDISRRLRISQKRISWAGTKDKNAITTQKISIFDLDKSDLEQIKLKDVDLTPIGRSNRAVSLGDLWGNRFRVVIRGITRDDVPRLLEEATSQIHQAGGVPNFFGIQRFGIQRPITHIVGKKIVEGDIKGAALAYIARPCLAESLDASEARQYVQQTRDFRGGLERYPFRLRFERAMMNHLVEKPDDFAGAFRVLSPNLRKMFVHAYQSYLFNRILSLRIQEGYPLNKALPGDIVCFKNAVGLPDPTRTQLVTADTLEGINKLVQRGRAFVTAPLIGYDTPLSDGVPGEIEQRVMEEEKVETDGFRVPLLPELSSRGLRREIIIPVEPVYDVKDDCRNPGQRAVELEFSLQRGAYATTLLREYMKTDPSTHHQDS